MFNNEKVFILISKSDWDGFTDGERTHCMNASINRKIENIDLRGVDSVDNYLFESQRNIALDCRFSGYKFYLINEIKIKLGL